QVRPWLCSRVHPRRCIGLSSSLGKSHSLLADFSSPLPSRHSDGMSIWPRTIWLLIIGDSRFGACNGWGAILHFTDLFAPHSLLLSSSSPGLLTPH
ncbi:Os09g0276600, partial [Oryza sativa Japonica Group]